MDQWVFNSVTRGSWIKGKTSRSLITYYDAQYKFVGLLNYLDYLLTKVILSKVSIDWISKGALHIKHIFIILGWVALMIVYLP